MGGEWDSLKDGLHSLKEPDYMMILMSLYGTLQMVNEEKKRKEKKRKEKKRI